MADPNSARLQSLERENERLQRAVEELSILNDLATAIGAARDVQEIIQTIIRRSLRAVKAEQGVITLISEDADDPTRTLVRMRTNSAEQDSFRPDESLLGWMHLYKKPLRIDDPSQDARFRGTRWHAGIRSILCVPMLIQSRLIGILTLYNKKNAPGFTEEDQRLLAILAGQSAQIVENARLYEEEKKLLGMQQELSLAYEIQSNLLPKEQPQIPGYDIAGASRPAQMVGGDYFDYIEIDARRLALCVADVSGKGLPASLLMANVQATLRGQALVGDAVEDSLGRANRLMCRSIRRGSFVTLFYGVLDLETHRFLYGNAGHNRPLFCSPGQPPAPLTLGDLVLGFQPTYAYREATLTFAPGDVLLIYSDGVTEAMNTAREQFGEDHLTALVAAHAHESATALIEKLLAAVDHHTGSAPQTDDMTLLVVKRL